MSTVYETPGVFIEEITGPGVIQALGTSVAAFVGPTARGPSTTAVRVTTFDQFVERFADAQQPHLFDDDSEEPFYLSFAVQGFFQNGGPRAHIARVSNGKAAWATLTNLAGGVEAIVRARQEGKAGNNIRIETSPSTNTWKLAAPTAKVVAQGPAVPPAPAGFPDSDQRVVQLDNGSAGFAAGDSVEIVMPPAAPIIDNPGDQRSAVGVPVDLRLTARAASGGALTFTETGLPNQLQIDPSGRITGTPDTVGPSSAVTVTASDGAQSTTVTFDWEIYQPEPTIASPGRQTHALNAPVNLQIQAQSRSTPPGTLSYTETGLPSALTLDPNTGTVTGPAGPAGFHDVSITVTDGSESATTRFAWVIDSPAAPIADNPGDQSTTAGTTVTLSITATPAAGGTLTFAASTLPPGLSLDTSTGSITGTPSTAATTAVTVTVSEAGGGSSSVTFDWVVTDPVPSITNPGRQTNNIGETVNLQIAAQAPAGTSPTFSAAGRPSGVTFDPATAAFGGKPTTAGVYDVSVTVTAGGTARTRFIWVVPRPIQATVERAEGPWLLLTGADGANPPGIPPSWPVPVPQDATIGLVDYPPDQAQIRLEMPALPAGLPAVGTWVEAGTGQDAQTFRVERVSSTGVVTIGRRAPGKDLSTRLHRDLTSLSFDLVITSGDGTTTLVPDLSLDPISERFLLAEGVVPTDVVVLAEPPVPLFKVRRMSSAVTPLSGGEDFDRNTLSSQDYQRALALLERVDEVSIVCVPDAARYDGGDRITRRGIQNAQLTHCLRAADRIALFDPPKIPSDDSSPEDEIANVVNDLRSERGFGALYYPWLQVLDPRSTGARKLTMLIPPSGHIAGVMARTDLQRGVFKAPANVTIDEVLGVERRLTDREQGPLNIAGVNVLRILPGSNRVTVWGARTTVDPFVTDWLYVNVRRLLLMIEESIQEAIRWAVFEPNDTGLWKTLRRVISAFLREQWQAGALFGVEEQDAFRVRIDEGLNPPSTRAKGYLYIEVKVAPVRPAEFIVVRIGLFDGGADVEEV